jgi:hypothetical protein
MPSQIYIPIARGLRKRWALKNLPAGGAFAFRTLLRLGHFNHFSLTAPFLPLLLIPESYRRFKELSAFVPLPDAEN